MKEYKGFYLEKEELELIVLIENKMGKQFHDHNIDKPYEFKAFNGLITELYLIGIEAEKLPKEIFRLRWLKTLHILAENVKEIPMEI